MTKNIKCFLELPYKNKKITDLPIILFYISWKDYYFELCDMVEYLPRGKKQGEHKLTISFALFYWYIKLTFYSPKH
jgi:hypothetical protein